MKDSLLNVLQVFLTYLDRLVFGLLLAGNWSDRECANWFCIPLVWKRRNILSQSQCKYIERYEKHEPSRGKFFTFRLFQIFEQPQNIWIMFAKIQAGSSSSLQPSMQSKFTSQTMKLFFVSSKIRSIYRTEVFFCRVSLRKAGWMFALNSTKGGISRLLSNVSKTNSVLSGAFSRTSKCFYDR